MKIMTKVMQAFGFVFCILMGSSVAKGFDETSYYHGLMVVPPSLAKTIIGGQQPPVPFLNSTCVSPATYPCSKFGFGNRNVCMGVSCDNPTYRRTVIGTNAAGEEIIDNVGGCEPSADNQGASNYTAYNRVCHDGGTTTCTMNVTLSLCGHIQETHCPEGRWLNDYQIDCSSVTCEPHINLKSQLGMACGR
jgi:hypothetical protein